MNNTDMGDVRPRVYKIIADAENAVSELIGARVHIQLKVNNSLMSLHEHKIMMLGGLVSDEFGVSFKKIAGKLRHGIIVDARRAYCYLAVALLGMSLADIGRTINRHHTSVIYLRRSALKLMDVDIVLKTSIKSIKTKFYENYGETEA